MKIFIIAFFIQIFFSEQIFCQKHEKNQITNISFEFNKAKSRRHKLLIEINLLDSIAEVKVKDNFSDLDTAFKITSFQFEAIVESIIKIKSKDIIESMKYMGVDGSTSTIEFGNYQNFISYKIWEINSDVNNRKLNDYLNTCKLIFKTCNVEIKKYL